MKSIDINCDLGEGGANDATLMPLISSCNIACGGHFGNNKSIASAISIAIENDVHIGAHPSYPDFKNFGRKSLNISLKELGNAIFEQIKRVFEEAKRQKTKLHHVKAHGALYNDLHTDSKKSQTFVEQILKIDERLMVFASPNSALKEVANEKLKVMTEGFADRLYEEDFKLVSRKNPNAVLSDKNAVLKQVFSMVKEGKIQLENQSVLQANFDTICVHSDTPNSIQILRFLNRELPKRNIQIS